MPHKGYRHTWAIKGRGGARRSLALALLALLFVLVGACGGEDNAEDFDSAASAGEVAVDKARADGTTDTALALSTATSPADYGRDVIYRAAIAVEAPDVAAATREAVAIIQGLGGIVFGQQTFTKPQPRSEITFKVLPEDFALALERLAGVGQLVDQQISADDVTERIVNFESRIITSEASVLRLRKFLEEATNIDNVAFLERELLNRETDLETLRGQLRTLQDQVSLATITLTINQLPEPPIVVPDTGFSAAVRAGTDTLTSIANRLAVIFGVLVPFLPFIILVAAIVWWIRRRARRRTPSLSRRPAVEESRPSRPVEDEV